MALIQGAGQAYRPTKKKKKKPAAPQRGGVSGASYNWKQKSATHPAAPQVPGRVKSIAPFKKIAAKSQAGKSLTIKDLQYMQRLAWTSKAKGTEGDKDPELRQAIAIARRWIDGLKAKGGVDTKTAQGQKVNIGAGGLEYHSFHETGVAQPTKKYQGVLDSYAKNGGNDILFSGPPPTAADTATPATAPPKPQASDIPVPPADGPVRDIALGQWQATGTIPGPQKMVDLLSAGLSMTDLDPRSTNLGVPGADAWMAFMQTAHKFPSKVPPPADDAIPVGGSAADLMFKQADFSQAPTQDRERSHGFWGSGGVWNFAKMVGQDTADAARTMWSGREEYLGKTEVVYQGARDLDWFMGLDAAQKKEVQKVLAERGFTPAESGAIPTVNFVMPYVSVVNQFVYNSNLAAAMFSKDPHEKGDASDILKRTNVQGGGTELGQLAQSLNGSDDESFLTYVYRASMMARPVGVSESGFALWYAKKWGTENLPQTEQAGAQGVSKGNALSSFFEDLGAPAEVAWHYAATSGKLGDFITKGMATDAKAAGAIVGQLDKDLNSIPVVGTIKQTIEGGVSETFKGVNEVVALTIAEANRIAVAHRIHSLLLIDPNYKPGGPAQLTVTKDAKGKMVGTLDPTGKTFPNQDAVDHINGWSSLLETAAKAWKMSEGRGLWYEYLTGMGVDPAEHEQVALWGQFGIEAALCAPLQVGAAAIVGTALRSTPALAALKAFQVKSHAEILTASLSPSRIKALYNVTDPAAIELAAITDPAEMLLKLNGPDQFGAKFFDPDMHFTARSIAQNLRVKMMGDTKLAPTYRAFMSPLPEGIFDCVTDTDQQVLGTLRYAGVDSKTAHEFADGIIAARAGAADFPEMAVRSYLTHPKTGFNALIEKQLGGKNASKAFISANGASTKLDELNSFLRRFRGKKAGVGAPATRVGYSLRPGATVADRLEEGSLGLPAELTEPVLVNVRAANKVIESIDKQLVGADAKTAASLAKKRVSAETSKQAAIQELNLMPPQVVGMPTAATEAQFAKTFSPDYTPTELAIFSGGKSMQEWAILQKRLHLTDINSVYKRMWLSRMGTMFTIIGSDEMLRGMLNGVNPLGGIKGLKKLPGFEGTMSADAAEAALRSPSTMVDILDITDIKRATNWGEIGPDAADITTRNMGVHESLKTFNAKTSMPVTDWLEAYDAAYADLIADAERARLSPTVKPPKVGDAVPGVGRAEVDAQIAGLEREASILYEGKPEARAHVNIDQPTTDADLRAYIRAKGGISRDNAFWSKPSGKSGDLTVRENRAAFGYLDTPKGGVPIDELADLIANEVGIEFGIYDSSDLFEWLGKQGPGKATTTATEVNARLAEIEAEVARLQAASPNAPAPRWKTPTPSEILDPELRAHPKESVVSVTMTPEEYLAESTAVHHRVGELQGVSPEAIADFLKEKRAQVYRADPSLRRLEKGEPVDPLTLSVDVDTGEVSPLSLHPQQGDHRAVVAEQLGMDEVPVRLLLFRNEGGSLRPATAAEAADFHFNPVGRVAPKEPVSLSSLDEPTVAPTPVLSERDQIALHKAKASAAADAELGDLMHNDPRYIGGTTADGRKLTGLLPTRNPGAFDPQLLAEGLDNKPWIKSIQDEYNRQIHAMMSHNVTANHLRTGKIGPNDLKSATVQNIYGPVQYAIERNPVGSALTYLPRKVSDTVLGTLGHMATHLKKQEFGHFFDERMATLRGFTEAQMPRLEKMEVSRKYAVAKTDELSYLNGRTLVEENLRNVVLFLPAYRQFLTWWAKRFATHPFGTHMLMKGLSSIPPVRIPDDVKVIGGVKWDSSPMNFFAGLSGDGSQNWFPGLVPTITEPVGIAAQLTGNPEAVAFYKALNNGFEPGGPEIRWLDSLVYGAVGATFYDMEKRLGIPDPGSAQIDVSRKKRIVAEMVAQGVQTDGKGIDAAAATRAVRVQEAGKSGLQWTLPGTWGATKAKTTVDIPPQFGLPGYKMTLDMGRIAEAQWKYFSAITPEAKAQVLIDYPEYGPVDKAWNLQGEKQLEYLSRNRWVIGLTSQRNESPPEGTIVTPLTPPGKPLSMEDVAKKMKERYDQVDKYVLSQEYQKQKKLWDKGFAKKYKDRKGQAKAAVEDPKQPYQDWYYKPLQKKFYEDHNKNGEMDRLLMVNNKAVGLKEHTTVLKQAGEKHLFNNPYLFPDMLGKTQEQQLSQSDYEGMKRLEGSGLLWGKELVQGSRRYDQYVGMRKEEIADIQRRFLTAALAPYKSSVHPDDWALFGKGWDEKRGNKLLGFLTEIDKRSAALKKLTFATREYKAEYYKLKDYINTVRTKNPVLAPYIGATAPKLLSTGQLALDKPAFVDVKPKTMAEWEKLRTTLYSTPGVVTAKNVLKLKRSASPELQANWDEATRALCWDFTFRLAAQGRDALTKSNNPLGWYRGYTVESTYGQTMQKWMVQNLHAFTNSKAPISKSFFRQWGLADKAAGGNLVYDLLDPSK